MHSRSVGTIISEHNELGIVKNMQIEDAQDGMLVEIEGRDDSMVEAIEASGDVSSDDDNSSNASSEHSADDETEVFHGDSLIHLSRDRRPSQEVNEGLDLMYSVLDDELTGIVSSELIVKQSDGHGDNVTMREEKIEGTPSTIHSNPSLGLSMIVETMLEELGECVNVDLSPQQTESGPPLWKMKLFELNQIRQLRVDLEHRTITK